MAKVELLQKEIILLKDPTRALLWPLLNLYINIININMLILDDFSR